MKKLFPPLAALLIVLTSCISVTNPQNVQKNRADDLQLNEKSSSPVFYIDGELPDIGDFKSSPERYYSEYTPYFIPSDKYGRILPYTGKYKIFSAGEDIYGVTKTGYSDLGFCDADGKIIMDADSRNRNITYYESNDGFGFYLLSVTDKPENEMQDDVYIPQKSFLIPENGKWCLELDRGSWVNEARNGIIYVSVYSEADGRGESVLYDYDGKKIANLGEYDSITLSDCGLISAIRWDDDNSFQGFIDEKGNVVLGPYKSVGSFNSVGTAIVEEGTGFYLINTDGIHMTRVYADITEYKKDYKDGYGVYVARHTEDKNKSDVLDAKGKIIGTITGSSYYNLRFLSNGDIVYYYNDFNTNKMVWKRLSDNSDFICLEYGKPSNKYSGNHDYFVYEDEENKIGCVFDASGKTVLKIENFLELRTVSDSGKYFVYSTGKGYSEHYDEEKKQWISDYNGETYLYNLETKETTKLCDGDAYITFVGKDERYLITGYAKRLVVFADFDSYRLFDTATGEMIFDNCKAIAPVETGFGTYITVCGKNSCTLYDTNLRQIIKTYSD